MPSDPRILSFSNRWYPDGLKRKEGFLLPSGTSIDIFPLALYLASKFEALSSRGGNDWRVAHDLEDILLVLDGAANPKSEFENLDSSLRNYLIEHFTLILSRSDYQDILSAYLGGSGGGRIQRMDSLLRSLQSTLSFEGA